MHSARQNCTHHPPPPSALRALCTQGFIDRRGGGGEGREGRNDLPRRPFESVKSRMCCIFFLMSFFAGGELPSHLFSYLFHCGIFSLLQTSAHLGQISTYPPPPPPTYLLRKKTVSQDGLAFVDKWVDLGLNGDRGIF
jgi:hypothetical protein